MTAVERQTPVASDRKFQQWQRELMRERSAPYWQETVDVSRTCLQGLISSARTQHFACKTAVCECNCHRTFNRH